MIDFSKYVLSKGLRIDIDIEDMDRTQEAATDVPASNLPDETRMPFLYAPAM